MGNSKFFKGIMIGAIIGGAVSLFDRATRDSFKGGIKQVTNFIKHPNEAIEKVKDLTENMRTTIKDVSEDVTFIVDKIEELKEVTPHVAEMVKETKDAFTESKDCMEIRKSE